MFKYLAILLVIYSITNAQRFDPCQSISRNPVALKKGSKLLHRTYITREFPKASQGTNDDNFCYTTDRGYKIQLMSLSWLLLKNETDHCNSVNLTVSDYTIQREFCGRSHLNTGAIMHTSDRDKLGIYFHSGIGNIIAWRVQSIRP